LNDDQRLSNEIVAIAPDSKENLQKMVNRISGSDSGMKSFPFLSDPDHKVIDRYGLLNPNGRGSPHPATYVIDKKGVVRWRYLEVDYKKRPSNEEVLEALLALQ
jgi:peroxiredoxin